MKHTRYASLIARQRWGKVLKSPLPVVLTKYLLIESILEIKLFALCAFAGCLEKPISPQT
jgi:hypothetical protein